MVLMCVCRLHRSSLVFKWERWGVLKGDDFHSKPHDGSKTCEKKKLFILFGDENNRNPCFEKVDPPKSKTNVITAIWRSDWAKSSISKS